VPNLLGYDPVDARKIIEACDLVYDGATDVHTLSYEAIGKVGDQEPSGGEVIKKGEMVRGFVSIGLFVPNMIGWEVQKAEAYLRNFRHGVNVERVANPAEVGTVFAHEPLNAELYNSGTPVKLWVSRGPLFKLKDYKGEYLSVAIADALTKGLNAVHGGGPIKDEHEFDGHCTTIKYHTVVDYSEPPKESEVLPKKDTVKFFTRVAVKVVSSTETSDGKLCP
jgi:beta-lactam-binding protein with PASTA domain